MKWVNNSHIKKNQFLMNPANYLPKINNRITKTH